MATSDTPNPGSDAAIEQGCTCPVLDNRHGKGFLWDGASVFWITEKCPLHGNAANERTPMTTTLEAANEALRNAVRDRLDATPADDPKMQGYFAEPVTVRTSDEDLQQNQHVTLGYDVDTMQNAKERMDAMAEHYAEWDTFTRQTGDGVMGTRTPAEETLWQSVEAVRDRHEKYGPPTEHFARTAAMVNAAFGTTFSAADWALVMVLDKVARQRGPAATDDAAIDIAGYAACHQECRKAQA